jgi:hypothetical protein
MSKYIVVAAGLALAACGAKEAAPAADTTAAAAAAPAPAPAAADSAATHDSAKVAGDTAKKP